MLLSLEFKPTRRALVTAIIGDMLELSETNEIHISQAPTLISNCSGLVFGFDEFHKLVRAKCRNS